MSAQKPTLREYLAIVWTKEPNAVGQRVSFDAANLEEAKQLLLARFGDDVTFTLWNEADANRPRGEQ